MGRAILGAAGRLLLKHAGVSVVCFFTLFSKVTKPLPCPESL